MWSSWGCGGRTGPRPGHAGGVRGGRRLVLITMGGEYDIGGIEPLGPELDAVLSKERQVGNHRNGPGQLHGHIGCGAAVTHRQPLRSFGDTKRQPPREPRHRGTGPGPTTADSSWLTCRSARSRTERPPCPTHASSWPKCSTGCHRKSASELGCWCSELATNALLYSAGSFKVSANYLPGQKFVRIGVTDLGGGSPGRPPERHRGTWPWPATSRRLLRPLVGREASPGARKDGLVRVAVGGTGAPESVLVGGGPDVRVYPPWSPKWAFNPRGGSVGNAFRGRRSRSGSTGTNRASASRTSAIARSNWGSRPARSPGGG